MDKSTLEGEKARNKFKNSMGLFPILYGSEAHKVSVTAGLNKEEAQIGIDVIKSHAPTAAKFLEANRQHGSTYGYVIHNTRSGSRRWFQPMLDHIHYGYPMSKSKKVEVELAAGNSCIQGSGSDLLKEAMAMIACWNNIYKQDIR
jgi:DNA polymerase I-like protein with 3'-5' exonuclease and polymerase domains